VEPFHLAGAEQGHGRVDTLQRPVPPAHLQQHGDLFGAEAPAQLTGRHARHHGIGCHVRGHHGARGDDGAVTDVHAGHDHGFRTDPDIVAHHGVPGTDEAVHGVLEACFFRHVEKGEGGDPVHAVALIARHDEAGATADGTEGTDDELVHVVAFRAQVAGTVIEAVAVIIAGIVAVAARADVGIADLLVQRDALEGAFEKIHGVSLREGRRGRRTFLKTLVPFPGAASLLMTTALRVIIRSAHPSRTRLSDRLWQASSSDSGLVLSSGEPEEDRRAW